MRFAAVAVAVAAFAASASSVAALTCTIPAGTSAQLQIGWNPLGIGDKPVTTGTPGVSATTFFAGRSQQQTIPDNTYAVFRCDNPFQISNEAGIFCTGATGQLTTTAFPTCKDTCTVEYEYDSTVTGAASSSHWTWNGFPKGSAQAPVGGDGKARLSVLAGTILYLGCDAGYGLSGVTGTPNQYECLGSAQPNTWGLKTVRKNALGQDDPSSIERCWPQCNITWPAHGVANGLRTNSYANMATDVTYACDTNYALRDRCVQPTGRSISAGKVHCYLVPKPTVAATSSGDDYLYGTPAAAEPVGYGNNVISWWRDTVNHPGYNPFPYTAYAGLFSTPAECALTCSDASLLNGQASKIYDVNVANARCAAGADNGVFVSKVTQIFVNDNVRFQCNPGYTLSVGDSTTNYLCLGFGVTAPPTFNGGYDKAFPTCIPTQCTVHAPVNGFMTATSNPPDFGTGFTVATLSNLHTASFGCNAGYVMIGAPCTLCSGGAISPLEPTCVPYCPVTIPANGMVNGGMQSLIPPMGPAFFTCNAGYNLWSAWGTTEYDATTMFCGQKGTGAQNVGVLQWPGTVDERQPYCAPACHAFAPTNGLVNGMADVWIDAGSVPLYTCNSGYTLQASTQQTAGMNYAATLPQCGNAGTLIGAAPVCVRTCTVPTIANGAYNWFGTASRVATALEWVVAQCNTGYSLYGNSNNQCMADGTWKYTTAPQCVKTCTVNAFANGWVNGVASTVVPHYGRVMFTCQPTYALTYKSGWTASWNFNVVGSGTQQDTFTCDATTGILNLANLPITGCAAPQVCTGTSCSGYQYYATILTSTATSYPVTLPASTATAGPTTTPTTSAPVSSAVQFYINDCPGGANSSPFTVASLVDQTCVTSASPVNGFKLACGSGGAWTVTVTLDCTAGSVLLATLNRAAGDSSTCIKIAGGVAVIPSAVTPLCSAATVAPTTATPTTAGATSLGCGSDSPRQFTTQIQATSAGPMSVEICRSLAIARGFTYFNLQYGYECWGGSNVPTVTAASTCNYPCVGNSAQMCGGFFVANFYHV